LPITLDDYPLYRERMSYDLWEQLLLRLVGRRRFTAVSLHDCYAPWWIHRYPALLERLGEQARLCTMDEISAEVFLRNAA
jgi:hypothetical protein